MERSKLPWGGGGTCTGQVTCELSLGGWVGACELEREEKTRSDAQSCEKSMVCCVIEFRELTPWAAI